MADSDPQTTVSVEIARGVAALPRGEWDALNSSGNPFLSHDFLSLLEQSGSACPGAGWTPLPLVTRVDGALAAAMPAYLKDHSQGEYVFDHSWADAYARAGGRYYPKLQIAVPFTPVPGPRVLGPDPRLARALIGGAEQLVLQHELSSAHASFVAPEQLALFEGAGWLIRTDSQFHWHNRGYCSFEEFLAVLSSRKRKAIRKERSQAQQAVDRIVRLSGRAIGADAWDAMWHFYQDTGARKWGRPYLTRRAFDLLAEHMADRVVLILAERGGRWIAGALNLTGPDALYGRYWGATADVPGLHFELCYYQAIEVAIERGLKTVEAGAQGSHKLARGYEPTPTYSAHFIADPGFRAAVDDFLARERAAVAQEIEFLADMGPFRRGG